MPEGTSTGLIFRKWMISCLAHWKMIGPMCPMQSRTESDGASERVEGFFRGQGSESQRDHLLLSKWVGGQEA